jgi:hypothetical protein
VATRLFALVLAALLVTAICVPLRSPGCAVAPPRGERIEIADESAIIVWDAAGKTQHFIRRASFTHTSGVKDFGFLVPTPSYPQLAEASDEAFQTLEKITGPKTVTERRPVDLFPQFGCAAPKAAADKVQVLQEQRVAGYDAVVLEAREADALSKWLKEWGYDFAPELKEWAGSYVSKGWAFTAFKVAHDDKGERLATSAVRLTFPADRPYFPYREPANDSHGDGLPRRLRVYFVADARYKGVLTGAAWPGYVVWSNRVSEEDRASVLGRLNLQAETGPPEWRLTEFEDVSSPRPGHDDVYFERDARQDTLERPPHVIYTEPWAVDYFWAVVTQWSFCYGPFVLLWVVWWVWRRRRRNVLARSRRRA